MQKCFAKNIKISQKMEKSFLSTEETIIHVIKNALEIKSD